MDIKNEIEIKDELLSSDIGNDGQNFEQDSGLEEIQNNILYPNINVKGDVEMKDEPLDTEEEYTENVQLIEQISGLEASQVRHISKKIEPPIIEGFDFTIDSDSEHEGKNAPVEVESQSDSDWFEEGEDAPVEMESQSDSDGFEEGDDSDDDDVPIRKRRRIAWDDDNSEDEEEPSTSADSTGRLKRRERSDEDDPNPERYIHHLERGIYYGKDKTKWTTTPPVSARSNSPRPEYTSKPAEAVLEAKSELDCFAIFFDNFIIQEIVRCTNLHIERVNQRYKDKYRVKETSIVEIKAFIGVLIMSGAKKDNHVKTTDMWSAKSGRGLYRTAISEIRFNFLLRCLRFDDLTTRENREKEDKFTHIRNIWELFIEKCKNSYVPGGNITVAEQLLGFRGKCCFRQFVAKPAKYGIKIVLACDSRTSYMLNAIPYLGTHTIQPREMLLGEFFTTELMRPYFGTYRGVTTGNWFTSLSLSTSLLNNKISICGTLRKKPYVPEEMTKTKNRLRHSSAFLFSPQTTLLSYNVKPQKNVLLLSTRHHDTSLAERNKPEIICDYNDTKGGVDTFDQMCKNYSCSRKTMRWPLCVFFGILNAGIINSFIIYKHNNPGKKIKRKYFIEELATQLIKPNAEIRFQGAIIPRDIRELMITIFGFQTIHQTMRHLGIPPLLEKQKRCRRCPRNKDRKTRFICVMCREPTCLEHCGHICKECIREIK